MRYRSAWISAISPFLLFTRLCCTIYIPSTRSNPFSIQITPRGVKYSGFYESSQGSSLAALLHFSRPFYVTGLWITEAGGFRIRFRPQEIATIIESPELLATEIRKSTAEIRRIASNASHSIALLHLVPLLQLPCREGHETTMDRGAFVLGDLRGDKSAGQNQPASIMDVPWRAAVILSRTPSTFSWHCTCGIRRCGGKFSAVRRSHCRSHRRREKRREHSISRAKAAGYQALQLPVHHLHSEIQAARAARPERSEHIKAHSRFQVGRRILLAPADR